MKRAADILLCRVQRLVLAIFCGLLLLFATPARSTAATQDEISQHRLNMLLDSLRSNAVKYRNISPDYEAGIYIKGNVDVLSRGRYNDYIPIFKRLDADKNTYYAEFIGELTFTNPNIFNHSLYSISTNKQRFIDEHIENIVAPSIQLNVYSQYFLGQVYSPLAYLSGRYYNYQLDSTWKEGDTYYYRIAFSPRLANYKFVAGYLVANSGNFSIREIFVEGSFEFIRYSGIVQMGKEGTRQEFLPQKISLSTDIRFMGTHLKGEYVSHLRYNKILAHHIAYPQNRQNGREWQNPQNRQNGRELQTRQERQQSKKQNRQQYDLSLQYRTQVDTISAIAERIIEYRNSILNAGKSVVLYKDSSTIDAHKDSSRISAYRLNIKAPSAFEKMGRFMVRDYSLDLKELGQLHITPLVSPILFDYSSSRGLSYNQKLRLSRVTESDKLYYIEPRLGYNFKYKEVHWGINGEVNYAPRRMSRIFIDLGNGNKFSSRQPQPSDTLGGKSNEFRAIHARVGHKIEIANGLTLSTNLALHQYRQLHNHTNFYSTFVPEVELQYTPHQYYYMNGERKVYLYSRYPTFTINFAHSFKNILRSTTKFNKVEFDMQHRLKVGPMHALHYRVGFGLFYDYSDLHFAEFNNLRRNNLPEGWHDDIGGTFHLLTTVKYNEIDKYLRANIKYDAPLILVPSLFRKVKYITKERLYCNMLLVDTMDPYIEMGYGIGTNIFNIGLFWGGEITKWDMVGVKFTFEVFN